MVQADLIGQRLKLQHLKIAMTVAEWGSMAKAAKHLAISQPVVSKVIADLENLLGVRVFDRNPQGVELTLYGRALLKRSAGIFDDLKSSVEEVRFLADPTAGEVRIGSTEPLLAGIGAAVIGRMSERYPGIVFHVAEADSATLLSRELPERKVEFAIVPLLASFESEHLETTILFHDRLRVVVGASSRWARKRRITLAELVDEPWCVAPSLIGSMVSDAFVAGGLKKPRIAVSTTTSHLFMQLLESGRFVGHFGDNLLHFYEKRFALKRLAIDLNVAPFSVAIVTVRNRTLSPVARLFIECARKMTKPLRDGVDA